MKKRNILYFCFLFIFIIYSSILHNSFAEILNAYVDFNKSTMTIYNASSYELSNCNISNKDLICKLKKIESSFYIKYQNSIYPLIFPPTANNKTICFKLSENYEITPQSLIRNNCTNLINLYRIEFRKLHIHILGLVVFTLLIIFSAFALKEILTA